VTTRGMGEMERIAELVARALDGRDDEDALAGIEAEVRDLCARFPLYREPARAGA
jgi:glycine/serine hydroxymethyltransferase